MSGRIYVERHKKTVPGPIKTGISFGSCLAMVISYVTWRSILWAIVHGLLGWIYVVYFFIRYSLLV